MEQLLIVEDDIGLNQGLCKALKADDRQIISCHDLKAAREQLLCGSVSLVLLDINLPDGSGLELLREIKENTPGIPVILLTANDTDLDIVDGLERGADDYITKPFRPLVLGAKVKALIRRNKDRILDHASLLECGPFSYQYTTMRFFKQGQELDFSSRESALFLLFLQNPGQIFTKDMIYEAVWGNSVAVDDNAIMVYINRLRSKIEDDRQKPAHILTVRGLGYRFVP